MSTKSFSGVIPPTVTPYLESGALDLASLERLIENLIENGVSGLFALGSSGEAAFLTDIQRSEVLSTTVKAASGRVPVLAGVNEMTVNRVAEQIRIAEKAGIEALVVTAPFYALPSPAEVEDHFRRLAAQTSLPIFAYDVPVRVHRKLDLDMLIRLGQDGVIVGVKDSSGDDVSFRRLIAANKAAGSPLSLFTGHEVAVDGALLAGADGVVPGLGNVDPSGYVRMFKAAKALQWEEVRREQDRLVQLFEIVFQPSSLSGEAAGLGAFKTALTLLGIIDSNVMSQPIPRITGSTIDHIRTVLHDTGLLHP